MPALSLANKRKQMKHWHIVAEALIILLIIILAILPAGCETQLVGGRTYNFTSPPPSEGEILSYQWMATDGTPRTSSDATFRWTSPEVTEPTKVMVNLTVKSNRAICPGEGGLDLLIVPSGQPKISLKKDCVHIDPVRVGDSIAYTFNVTNSGNVPLTDINLTDMQDWGPDCRPVYVRGDNGDGILNPGETWWYECNYIVPDPSDYQRLYVMSDGSSEAAIIQRLYDLKVPLAMKMDRLKEKRQQFNAKLAVLSIDHKLINGTNYTLYNYTNTITGESLSRWNDQEGRTIRRDYSDPVTQAILTDEYNSNGSLKSDAIHLLSIKESLKIDYNIPSYGLDTYTIIDYTTGDTLIVIVIINQNGKILSKEYRKTPGYRPYEEKYYLKDTASVTGKAPDGSTVSDMDSFQLEIYKQLPVLRITKTGDHDSVFPGGKINYTITYENVGKEVAHQVVVKEKYDQYLIFQSADPIPDAGTNNVWTLGDLSGGQSGTIKIASLVSTAATSGSIIMNVADVTCKENSTDEAAISTSVQGNGLNITKTAPALVLAGGTLTYTIDYRNDGPGSQTNVTINDYLDPNVVFQSSTPNPTDSSGRHYWWNVGDLNAGDSGKISIVVNVNANAPEFINNYYKIGNNTLKTLKTMVVNSLWISKNASKKIVSPGDNVTYTILYGNAQNISAYEVTVTDILPDVDLLMTDPSITSVSGKNLTWDIGILKAHENGSITVMVQIPKRPELGFHEESTVSGVGYAYVNKKLSTVEPKPALVNKAVITGTYILDNKLNETETGYSTVTILGAAGTELTTYEHGSGYYKEDERSSLRSKNHSIALDKDITAQHNNTVFSLPLGRNIKYKSLWADRTVAKNHVLNDVVSENYLYMDSLDKKSSFRVDENQTVYRSESDFGGGIARIDYSKHAPNVTATINEISESYHGSFRVLESVDSYGESTKYKKSVKGSGFVSSDKRTSQPVSHVRSDLLQRSYEYGSGYYNSEESSELGYVVKSSKMAYAPANLAAGSINTSYASLWNEGMITKDPSKALILSEDIRSASYINKDAWMATSSLSFMGEFNGSMDIKAVMNPIGAETTQTYQNLVGNYSVNTAMSVYTNPKYLYPHVSLYKEVFKEDENTMLFVINVTNDGNGVLKPLYLTDRLAKGMNFLSSSLRPDINGQIINWTIPILEISRTQTIRLRAKVENDHYPYINIAKVTAIYNGHILTATNTTSFTPYYLPCCLGAYPKEVAYLANIFNASIVQGQWGEWSPPPCFNVTTEATDCFRAIDDYYNELEKNESGCCPISSYDVP